VHSHVALLDDKLRSAEFFDAARFPAITFVSTRVERGETADRFRVTGDLTAHGVTRPVVLEVKLNRAETYPMLNVPALGFDARACLQRSDFGLGEGVPMVGDEIEVRITAEAMEAKGYAKAMKRMKAMSGAKGWK